MRSVVVFFQAEDGIRDYKVTGVQTCALPIFRERIAVLDGSWGVLIQRDVRGEEAYRGERFRKHPNDVAGDPDLLRSEERRVGKEGRSRWWPYLLKKKTKTPNAQSEESRFSS